MKAKTFPMPTMPTGASPSGNHYINLFQSCARKFYLRYVLGWKPNKSSSPLLNGSAFHHSKAVFYATRSRVEAQKAVARYLAFVRKEYETEDELALARTRLPAMISAWIAKFGERDLTRYVFLEIEAEHKVILFGGFSFTLRLDALVRDREGNLLVLETKTSSWRPELTELDLFNGDQASAYIACVREMHDIKLSRLYLLPDICSWPRKSLNVSQINCYRGELVQRDSNAIEEWKIGVSNLLAEISQKVNALKTHSEYALFPRNTQWCTSFSRPCEYISVCRQRFENDDVPYGFRKDADLPDLFPKKGKQK
jgi:hypothetical protein